jgi:hypothetical protein
MPCFVGLYNQDGADAKSTVGARDGGRLKTTRPLDGALFPGNELTGYDQASLRDAVLSSPEGADESSRML